MNLSTEKKITNLENRLWLPRGRGGSGMDWKIEVNRCRLLPLEWVSNEILQYTTGNYV